MLKTFHGAFITASIFRCLMAEPELSIRLQFPPFLGALPAARDSLWKASLIYSAKRSRAARIYSSRCWGVLAALASLRYNCAKLRLVASNLGRRRSEVSKLASAASGSPFTSCTSDCRKKRWAVSAVGVADGRAKLSPARPESRFPFCEWRRPCESCFAARRQK